MLLLQPVLVLSSSSSTTWPVGSPRNSAATGGSSQRILVVRLVGLARHENRWSVVWALSPHLGQFGSSARLFLYQDLVGSEVVDGGLDTSGVDGLEALFVIQVVADAIRDQGVLHQTFFHVVDVIIKTINGFLAT